MHSETRFEFSNIASILNPVELRIRVGVPLVCIFGQQRCVFKDQSTFRVIQKLCIEDSRIHDMTKSYKNLASI